MTAKRISEFDTWRPNYGGAVVRIYVAGTTTLASVYTNEGLSVAADNPQTLDSYDLDGVSYGKFTETLYTSSPYYLDIDASEQTGVERPALTTLAGEDASAATVQATSGSTDRTLAAIMDDLVKAADYGTISTGSSAATNTATMTAAIAAAAALGGGDVMLPAGTLQFTSLTLSSGVRLVGRGRDVTTLVSTYAGKTVTVGGDRAGLKDLTLDGSNLTASSTGLYSKANDETVFDNVLVKRFETGIHFRGGQRANWRGLSIDNCATGAKLHGDTDASGGADGDEFSHNRWTGGLVSNCTTYGVEVKYVDQKAWNNRLAVIFKDNTGTALHLSGVRSFDLDNPLFTGNTTDFLIEDGSSTTIGVRFNGGKISGGAATFKNTLQDVVLERMYISDVDFTLTSPTNNVVFRDCTEDSLVTIAGDGTKLTRCMTMLGDSPASAGTTTNNTATKGWSYELAPGEVIWIEAKVIGVALNTADYSVFHIGQAARRPGSTLAYDAQTANFTLGDILTGGTSGATARIIADSDSGATGTLTLRAITGAFQDNELITDEHTGSATVNGTLTPANAALLGSITSIEAAVEADASTACVFTANGTSIECTVTGVTSKNYSWTISANVTSGE